MVVHFAVAFTTRSLLQRESPICGNMQTAPPSKMHETVSCERCDYRISPRPKETTRDVCPNRTEQNCMLSGGGLAVPGSGY